MGCSHQRYPTLVTQKSSTSLCHLGCGFDFFLLEASLEDYGKKYPKRDLIRELGGYFLEVHLRCRLSWEP